jgi:hypothetical protein
MSLENKFEVSPSVISTSTFKKQPGETLKYDWARIHRILMTHKYRGSQQSSRKVKPKFIDLTQGEPKNIYKP